MGQFENDVSTGLGIYETRVGNECETYCGRWRQGMFDGYGLYQYSDGSLYMGQYSNDQKHGVGVLKQAGIDALKQVRFTYD